MKISLPKLVMPIVLIVMLVSSGCATNEKTIEELSQHYKQYGDYESLVALLPYLNYTMTRSDVEKLLGEGWLCPVPGSCTYYSDRFVITSCPDGVGIEDDLCQRFHLALVVSYDLVDITTASPQDVLTNWHLFPVGE